MIPRFPVIVGPTAGGKSGVAVRVCELIREGVPGAGGARGNSGNGKPGVVVTMDSMQVYRGMDIGTAKPTVEERRGVTHRMIDLVEPSEAFSVERWLRGAEGVIDEVRGEGGVPVVAGGTHLYAKALLEGLFDGPGVDAGVRAALESMTPEELRAELERVDPASAARLHPNDRRRTVRALEVFRVTGEPMSARQTQWDRGRVREDAVLFGLWWEAEALNRRINARVREMVSEGLVGEVRGLWERGAFGEQSREALGYKQLIAHFEGRCTLNEAVERIKIETRRFAKNQRTWLRRLRATPGSVWFDAAAMGVEEMAGRVAEAVVSARDA